MTVVVPKNSITTHQRNQKQNIILPAITLDASTSTLSCFQGPLLNSLSRSTISYVLTWRP